MKFYVVIFCMENEDWISDFLHVFDVVELQVRLSQLTQEVERQNPRYPERFDLVEEGRERSLEDESGRTDLPARREDRSELRGNPGSEAVPPDENLGLRVRFFSEPAEMKMI